MKQWLLRRWEAWDRTGLAFLGVVNKRFTSEVAHTQGISCSKRGDTQIIAQLQLTQLIASSCAGFTGSLLLLQRSCRPGMTFTPNTGSSIGS